MTEKKDWSWVGKNIEENSTSIEIGSVLISSSGVAVKVTNIKVGQLHLTKPNIWISYDYDDNGNRGNETVSLSNFQNNLAS